MTVEEFERVASALRAGEEVPNAQRIKESRVRLVARLEDTFLKVFFKPGQSRREARALLEAERRGIPVPKLLGAGSNWIATRWIEGRGAERKDLSEILGVVDRMHERGMLHRDLHTGNLLETRSGIVITDLQRALFLPWIPGVLRQRELGWLAYSLGEPIPAELEAARFWRDLRAHTHWRSRTKRCVKESGSFTRFAVDGLTGFRRREADPVALTKAFDPSTPRECLKSHPRGSLYRSEAFILKEHPSIRAARRAWINARGLDVRGIGTAPAIAWAGRWLVMEDAGATVTDFADGPFASAGETERAELGDRLGGLLADLHRRGIYHADLKANNVAWVPGSAARLLDYDRVRFGWSVPTRRRVKNLAQLNAALPDGVPASLRERALRRYLERSRFRGDPKRLQARVIELSLRRAHRWQGC
jgi:tRNA A-37 threonylcarbamoyl transferase component Bud32